VAGAKHPESAALARLAGRDGVPVVLLTPTASEESLGLAADSGALLHLVEPVTSQGLAAAVRLAVARAEDQRAAAQSLGKLRESVAIREVVERAKGILMDRFGFTEEEAHRRLQTESRTRNRKLAETAWHVIQVEAQLGGRRRRGVAS
jgi:response regulator NasT